MSNNLKDITIQDLDLSTTDLDALEIVSSDDLSEKDEKTIMGASCTTCTCTCSCCTV